DTLVITTPARVAGEAATPSRALAIETRAFATETAARTPSPCARAADAVARARPDPALAARVRTRDVLAGWWVTSAPEARYPAQPGFSMSASKLGSYTRCARQFFYREILDIEEDESIYLQVGSLVHDALKEIIAPGATGDEVLAALQHAGTREIAERLVTDTFKDAGAWMRELSVKYLEDMLRYVAQLESQRQGSYRVRVVEETVEAVIEGMPLRGRFDRVDDVDGVGPVIIDYKTSGKGKIRKTYPSLVENLDTDYWQIPVYGAVSEVNDLHAAAFVFYALPPGEEGFAVGVQLKPGTHPAPIPTGKRPHVRYGPVDTVAIADAMAYAVEIHRAIVEGETRYERTDDIGICPNCYFARICQRSKASL
ncbi:MAG TPA: PD-(D/E)XK nuclease family protein, partial [Candidatus Krumholzibacteria bacterium]|nr:PD-(D/E)XK nuclease family protein [Candidatus Krumholzibacteria bacterium]